MLDAQQGRNPAVEDPEPRLQDWLKRRALLKTKDEDTVVLEDDELPGIQHSLPECLQGISNLPPSLLPPTKESYVGLPYEEWGWIYCNLI